VVIHPSSDLVDVKPDVVANLHEWDSAFLDKPPNVTDPDAQ
jgi:hypothetical protein